MSVTRLLLPGVVLTPGSLVVPSAAARHARVARVRPGEAVEVLDLAGVVAVGRLTSWHGGECHVHVDRVEHERGEPPAPLVLALGVTQGSSFDWAVEKATELGATAVQPVISSRVQHGDASSRLQRWRRVSEAAVAQCGRSRPAAILDPRPLTQVIEQAPGRRFLADPVPAAAGGRARDRSSPGATVLVGPEGGLEETERSAVLAAGFEVLALGPRILRAETAAVAGLILAQQRLGWLPRGPAEPDESTV